MTAGFVTAAAPNSRQSAPPIAKLERGEVFPGGAATSRGSVDNANAFSHASGNMAFEDELKFKVGNGMFKKVWVSSPASTLASDGLGPLFNARSCQACHIKDGRGHPPADNDDSAVSMLLRLSIPAPTTEAKTAGAVLEPPVKTAPEPVYGEQLQDLSVQGHEAEGKINIIYEEKRITLKGGETVSLRAPHYSVANPAYGPLHPQTMISPRIAPPMIGLGLLEAIPDSAILALADPDDKNRDGVSGRPHIIPGYRLKTTPSLGRFA
ncbi:MAG: di-heme oxidoredictase family protein [Hyphomicrobiales bacterium]|nr:di-heme oxidoredictase family protein [Hyphomicrobiales bacterium]